MRWFLIFCVELNPFFFAFVLHRVAYRNPISIVKQNRKESPASASAGKKVMLRFTKKDLVYRKDGSVDAVDSSAFFDPCQTELLLCIPRWDNEENCQKNTLHAFAEPGAPLEVVYFADDNSPLLQTTVIPKAEVVGHPDIWHRCPKCGNIYNDDMFSNESDECQLCQSEHESFHLNDSWHEIVKKLKNSLSVSHRFFEKDGTEVCKANADFLSLAGHHQYPVEIYVPTFDAYDEIEKCFASRETKLVPFIYYSAGSSSLVVLEIPETSVPSTAISLGEGGYIDSYAKSVLDESNR